MGFAERDAYNVVFGKVIARLRQKHDLNQGDLADHLGVQQSTISRLEAGQVALDQWQLRQLADCFGITQAQLVKYVDDAYARTEAAARGATTGREEGSPWWQDALKVAGIIGIAGLAVFAVAAVVDDGTEKQRR